MKPDQIRTVLAEADCLHDEQTVERELDRLAAEISRQHADTLPIILCVMTGGLIPVAGLLARLHSLPLELDYIHATRYRGDIHGREIEWKTEPRLDLRGRDVIVVDDILDEGITLAAIVEYCEKAGASAVSTAVLVEKQRPRKADITADHVGLQIVDRYVFGYGMDYKGYLRNARGIYAVKGL